MYDYCIDIPILSIDRVWHGSARLDVYAVAERATPVLLSDLLVHVSYKMQRIKTSQILMLRIKPIAKLKSSREKPAIR